MLTCMDCGAAITARARTGRCRHCAISRPCSAETRARMSAGARESWARRLATEEGREAARRMGQAVRAHPNRATPEAEARRIEGIRRAFIGWCPPEHRDLNTTLRSSGMSLAERQRIILDATPGTPEHARRQIENHAIKQRLRAERERREAY